MDSWHLSSSPLPFSLSLISLMIMVFVEIPLSLCQEDLYSTCGNIRFSCGNIRNIGFPFWGDIRPSGCGYPGLKLNCERSRSVATIEIMNVNYSVLDVDFQTQILKISREDLNGSGICSPVYVNSTLDPTLFDFGPAGHQNLTLYYGCAPYFSAPFLSPITCIDGGVVHLELGAHGHKDCNASMVVPIPRSFNNSLPVPEKWSLSKLEKTIGDGFDVRWKVDTAGCSECMESMGVCGYDLDSIRQTCYHSSEPSRKRNLKLAIPIGVVGIAIISLVIICIVRRRHLSSNAMVEVKRDTKNHHTNAEKIVKSYGSVALKIYTYSALKKLTNSFKDKVGQGGYGVVYKGKLPDGRVVAVKVLSESKGNGEEFINEVASISGTSHVNIVTLLGFCYEKTKRALIYEFVPNGSLDKFIYDEGSSITKCHLDKTTMFQIAIGIARGLEYLHRGCKTRILHLDIKPHNILLGEDLCPKISDFGLAKLCKTKESIVSMTGMRGTVGYIAPEVFSRSFGGVSHKSDVYSYGMLVLEMVGGRKNYDGEVSHTSEIYFPQWIYNKLERGEIFYTHEDRSEDEEDIVKRDVEEEIVKRMIIVSEWCIQTNPSDRPSMGKVIEMLECNIQYLQFPPKPFLNSLAMSHQNSSTAL